MSRISSCTLGSTISSLLRCSLERYPPVKQLPALVIPHIDDEESVENFSGQLTKELPTPSWEKKKMATKRAQTVEHDFYFEEPEFVETAVCEDENRERADSSQEGDGNDSVSLEEVFDNVPVLLGEANQLQSVKDGDE